MAFPSVTYTFSNSTTADATQVNQNFQDIISGLSDGTKDLSISALTVAGNASFSGNVTLGNATGDDVTVTGSLASTINIKTTNSYNIGSATLGLAGIYFGQSGGANTSRVVAPVVASDLTHTLPSTTGTVLNEKSSAACKCWIEYTSVTTTAITASYNVTSVTDNGTGNTTITIATDFASAGYSAVASSQDAGSAVGCLAILESKAAGTLQIITITPNTLAAADTAVVCAAMFGAQ